MTEGLHVLFLMISHCYTSAGLEVGDARSSWLTEKVRHHQADSLSLSWWDLPLFSKLQVVLPCPKRVGPLTTSRLVERLLWRKQQALGVACWWRRPCAVSLFLTFFYLFSFIFCLHVHLYYAHTWSEGAVESPRTGGTDGCGLLCGCWEVNCPLPREEQVL